jgi:hypothetical protein
MSLIIISKKKPNEVAHVRMIVYDTNPLNARSNGIKTIDITKLVIIAITKATKKTSESSCFICLCFEALAILIILIVLFIS